jgi:hypothetical protein
MKLRAYFNLIIIFFPIGPLSVSLYETSHEKKTKVISSLVDPTLTTNGIKELNKNLIISKQLADPNDLNILDIIHKYVDEIDRQIGSNGLSDARIITQDSAQDSETNQQNFVAIRKDEVNSLIQKYVEQAYRLINAILQEQNITINDVTIANYCSHSFKFLIGEMLQKYFPDANKGFFNGFDELSVQAGIGNVVSDYKI